MTYSLSMNIFLTLMNGIHVSITLQLSKRIDYMRTSENHVRLMRKHVLPERP